MKNLSALVGRVFRYTPKGVRHGCQLDRVLFVAYVGCDDAGEYLVAWKVEVSRVGFVHPLYKRATWRVTDRMFSNPSNKSKGAKPTACFVPDSFVTLTTVEQLQKEYKSK